MRSLIEQHRAEIAGLCRRYAVRRLAVFGSAARGSDFDAGRSDTDFLVEFEPAPGLATLERYLGLADDLEHLLGCRVDLVDRDAIDASRNYILHRQILAGAEPVYG